MTAKELLIIKLRKARKLFINSSCNYSGAVQSVSGKGALCVYVRSVPAFSPEFPLCVAGYAFSRHYMKQIR